MDTPDIDMKNCCESLLELLKIDKSQDEHNDRQTMFRRSQFAIKDDRFKHICEKAAFNGHIECMKLAHEIGVPWDTVRGTTGYVSAREIGCHWNKYTSTTAASNVVQSV
ncbi:unnamed protein product [Macrosiphum euphorbiae]|uniref:Uncharacterized protein n=1 Tax=Macrosiphum euphorbiae TaxID=13131 RepID=A0AAV0WUY3_9HEMI|nr:unnamed protein product [Macrosiphum euphorbiae]